VAALRELGRQYTLFTASNEVSHELEGYLEGMGVAELFHGFYGPDLIDATKHHDTYYQRLFVDAGVDPAESLVVDDKVEFVRLARAAGARVVRVGDRADETEGVPVIASLAELPALIKMGAC
jgi:FMN phosphatase YigB (HAD superfamily)